jgi:hypothetical protein
MRRCGVHHRQPRALDAVADTGPSMRRDSVRHAASGTTPYAIFDGNVEIPLQWSFADRAVDCPGRCMVFAGLSVTERLAQHPTATSGAGRATKDT